MFVHCGVLSVGARRKLGLPSPFEMRFGNPLDLQGVALAHPRVPVIIPHFGAGMFREALMLADACPNVHFDTSSSNAWMRYTPGLTLTEVFRTALGVLGAERLLFGTDSSFFPRGWQAGLLATQVAALDAAGATPEQSRLILGGNFARMFPVTLRAWSGVLLDVHDDVRGRPAALVAAAAVARAVVDDGAQPVLARRAEGRRGRGLDEARRVALVDERQHVVGDLHVPGSAILLPDDAEVAAPLGAARGGAAAGRCRRRQAAGEHPAADDGGRRLIAHPDARSGSACSGARLPRRGSSAADRRPTP